MADDFESFLRRQNQPAPLTVGPTPLGPAPATAMPEAPPTPQPAAAVAPDSFETFLRRAKGQQAADELQQAQAATVANSQASAATAGQAARVAREIDLPQAAVETDLPMYQQRALAQRNARVLEQNPIVARWVAANPDSARVAQDEYEQLGMIERRWQDTKGLGYAALQGLGGSYNSAALGLNRVLQPWVRLLGGDKTGDWWGRAMIEPRMEAQKAFELTGQAGIGQRSTQMVGHLLGLLSQVTLTGGAGGQPIPAAAGALETMRTATATAAQAMAFPSLTESVNRAHDVFEKTGDAGAAYRAAIGTYLFTTAQGIVPFSAPGTLLQRAATGAVSGGVTAEAQRGVNNLLMPAELQQPFDPNEALFQAMTGAALGGVLGPRNQPALYAAVRQTYTEALRAEQAQSAIEHVQAVGEIASKSALREADPGAFRRFMEEVTDSSELEAVYIDPRTLAEALKQSPALGDAITDLRQQLIEAGAQGTDVRIPIADYATHIAGSPLEAALLPGLKATADGMTYAEAQAHFQNQQQTLEAVVKQAAEAQTKNTALAAEADTVYRDILGQLEAVKRFSSDVNQAYAAMTRDFYTVLAERTGESVAALHKRYGLTIAAERLAGGELVTRKPISEAAQITERFERRLQNYEQAVADYAKLPDAGGGKVLNTDTARELSPDYLANRTRSAAVHEPASAFIKKLYAQKLKEAPKPGELPLVLFTAGGTGAGKSSAIKGLDAVSRVKDQAQIVYDTNMNKFDSAVSKIDQALAAGKVVRIAMVVRDPVDALINGALPRAEGQAKQFGSGRTVPINEHVKTHIGAMEVVPRVAKHYADDPRVQIVVIDNTQGRGKQAERDLPWLESLRYNDVEQQARAALEREREEGRISDATYEGFAGKPYAARDDGRTAQAAGAVRPEPGPSPREVPEAADRGEVARAPGEGRESEVLTERGQAVRVKFRLVDAADLITSHDDDLKANKDFPQELQPRDRERAASAEQIRRIEGNIRPVLLGDSAKASDGAPIVGPDMVVESGNARTIALRRAYKGDKADVYRTWLAEHAEEFGLKAEDVKAMDQPVLVRERLDDIDRAEFARQANEGTLAAMSVTEIARSDAARLTDLSGLEANDDGTINANRSAEFIQRFMREAVGPNEAGAVMQKSGELSATGMQRLRNAIFAKGYGDADLVAMLTESTDANVRNILAGMLRAAPALAKLRDLQDSGARAAGDLAPPLVQAVRLFSQLRREGRTVEQYLQQGSMFDAGHPPEIESLLRGLEERSRAPKRVAEMIEGMVQDIDSLGDPRQMGMFGGAVDPGDVVSKVADRVLAQGDRGQISFADFGRSPIVLALLKNADLSTFLHESGHFYLEVYADVAARGGPKAIADDVQSVMNWFGVRDLAAWRALPFEQQRDFHEKFARGFEAYLLEGKAPSAELRPMFARFRSWLLQIYRSVRALGAEISSEVRGVFDRMLASEDAIREAEAQRRYEPLFKTAADAGIPEKSFGDYLAIGQEASDQALDTMQARSMRDMKWASNAKSRALRDLQRQADAEREAITAEVTREIDATPAFQAKAFLRAQGVKISEEWHAQRGTVESAGRDAIARAEAALAEWDAANKAPPKGEPEARKGEFAKRESVLAKLRDCLR